MKSVRLRNIRNWWTTAYLLWKNFSQSNFISQINLLRLFKPTKLRKNLLKIRCELASLSLWITNKYRCCVFFRNNTPGRKRPQSIENLVCFIRLLFFVLTRVIYRRMLFPVCRNACWWCSCCLLGFVSVLGVGSFLEYTRVGNCSFYSFFPLIFI